MEEEYVEPPGPHARERFPNLLGEMETDPQGTVRRLIELVRENGRGVQLLEIEGFEDALLQRIYALSMSAPLDLVAFGETFKLLDDISTDQWYVGDIDWNDGILGHLPEFGARRPLLELMLQGDREQAWIAARALFNMETDKDYSEYVVEIFPRLVARMNALLDLHQSDDERNVCEEVGYMVCFFITRIDWEQHEEFLRQHDAEAIITRLARNPELALDFALDEAIAQLGLEIENIPAEGPQNNNTPMVA